MTTTGPTTDPTTETTTFAAFEYPTSLPAEVDGLLARVEALTERARPLMAEVWRMWRKLEEVNDSLLPGGCLDWGKFTHMLDIAGIRAGRCGGCPPPGVAAHTAR